MTQEFRNVTLAEMLDARERRAARQAALLKRYGLPMICFTMNIAGPVKDSPLIRRGFSYGNDLLRQSFLREKQTPVHQELIMEHTGHEAFYVLDMPPLRLKQLAAELEEHAPVGRLFDMDVLDSQGNKINRADIGLSERKCMICGQSARACARNRTHTVADLQAHTQTLLHSAVEEADRNKIAALAVQALLYEVCTTPKPGLVDRSTNGSHKDMDIFTFLASSAALTAYFAQCAGIGLQAAAVAEAPKRTFCRLRTAGKIAEGTMLTTTGGVNTHKGAIFSMGLACAALGRLTPEDRRDPEAVLAECAAMTVGISTEDLAGVTKENAVTMGQKLYVEYGIRGARGQAEDGFPSVLYVGLPVLEKGIAQGYGIDRSGSAALLALMAASTDTNMIARGGIDSQRYWGEKAKSLLISEPYPLNKTLSEWDRECYLP